jgi:hypothetical protein
MKQKYAQVESHPHRLEVYETVLHDQLTTIFYCYSGAALFPPQSVSLPRFSDPDAIVDWLKSQT